MTKPLFLKVLKCLHDCIPVDHQKYDDSVVFLDDFTDNCLKDSFRVVRVYWEFLVLIGDAGTILLHACP
jgi:hypothetical protein